MIIKKWWLECKLVNKYDDNTWCILRKFNKKPTMKKIKKELNMRASKSIYRIVKIYEQ